MLASHGFNSDVQLPYRLPITAHTYSCDGACLTDTNNDDMVMAAQFAQDAQAGYACDYSNKRQPMAFSEVKECIKGIRALGGQLRGDSIGYQGKRYALRLCSDWYGKGIVRGQAENTNLRANSKPNDITSAETFRTSQTISFFGGEYLTMVEQLNDKKSRPGRTQFPDIDARNPRRRTVRLRHVATLYGQRPKDPRLWHMSPYEFVMYWEVELLSYPLSLNTADDPRHHACLTDAGIRKLKAAGHCLDVTLDPGDDYCVMDGGVDARGRTWLPFPDHPSTEAFRHSWIICRRRRPSVPSFAGAPLPKHSSGEHQRAAAIVMAYFHPWTLRSDDQTEHVPQAGALRHQDETWQDALQTWLDTGVVCEEAARYVTNFLSVHRVRPQDDDDFSAANSDDVAEDEELEVNHDNLTEALLTRIGGRGGAADSTTADSVSHKHNSTDAMGLSDDIWNCAFPERYASNPSFTVPGNLTAVLKEAAASRQKEHTWDEGLADARDAHVIRRPSANSQDIDNWVDDLPDRIVNGRPLANAGQLQAVTAIAARVKCELEAEASTHPEDHGHPFRQLLHGGPGTGKSHVIHLMKELFTEVLGWTQGVHFQTVALQAVTAALIGGDTIHHACGIPVFSNTTTEKDKTQSHVQVAKRVLQWRWLIIDEISMVSAKLLAQLDVKLRTTIREIGTYKIGTDQHDLPFGGLNVLLVGDFWQLEPPEGGFLGAIPHDYIIAARKYAPAPTICHGQALIWGDAAVGLHGILELTECERCDDEWLREVQDEIRHGALSEDNYNFLHGKPTAVPGSYVAGKVACGNQHCVQLAASAALPAHKKGAPTKHPRASCRRNAAFAS